MDKFILYKIKECENMYSSSDDLERMYPEVYRIVYPMVCSTCDRIQFPNTIT